MSAFRINDTPNLRLVRGDLGQVVRVGNVSIQFSPRERPPFAVSAVAVEQDTALVLDEETALNMPYSSLKQLGKEMERFSEPLPGSIVVQRGKPRKLYAIIHDLEQDPTWREEWVLAALENMLRLADQQLLPALALPLLGSHFGNLAPERFIQLLCIALRAFPPSTPVKLWLVVPRYDTHRLLVTLRHYSG